MRKFSVRRKGLSSKEDPKKKYENDEWKGDKGWKVGNGNPIG